MKGQSIPARGLNFFVSTGDGQDERRNFVFVEKHALLFLGITFGFSDGSKNPQVRVWAFDGFGERRQLY